MNNKTSAASHAANAVAEAMQTSGFSRLSLASATGIPSATLYRRLQGRPPGFTVDELERVADQLGREMTDLLPRTRSSRPAAPAESDVA